MTIGSILPKTCATSKCFSKLCIMVRKAQISDCMFIWLHWLNFQCRRANLLTMDRYSCYSSIHLLKIAWFGINFTRACEFITINISESVREAQLTQNRNQSLYFNFLEITVHPLRHMSFKCFWNSALWWFRLLLWTFTKKCVHDNRWKTRGFLHVLRFLDELLYLLWRMYSVPQIHRNNINNQTTALGLARL